jgi:hypothetical protein
MREHPDLSYVCYTVFQIPFFFAFRTCNHLLQIRLRSLPKELIFTNFLFKIKTKLQIELRFLKMSITVYSRIRLINVKFSDDVNATFYLRLMLPAPMAADPHHIDADPDPSFNFGADPGPNFQFDVDVDLVPHRSDANLYLLSRRPSKAPLLASSLLL